MNFSLEFDTRNTETHHWPKQSGRNQLCSKP